MTFLFENYLYSPEREKEREREREKERERELYGCYTGVGFHYFCKGPDGGGGGFFR
jgi:hypothetical protein